MPYIESSLGIVIVSDIDGNLVGLEAVLNALVADAADLTVNLGDCSTTPLWRRETYGAARDAGAVDGGWDSRPLADGAAIRGDIEVDAIHAPIA